MAQKGFRQLSVTQAFDLTPNMRRVVFTGASLADFTVECESGYVKLLFNAKGAAITEEAALRAGKPQMRTYTIRAFDTLKQTLTIDFAIHKHTTGPASSWAMNAVPGDTLLIAGPGPAKHLDSSADWFCLVGDMTSLPAISGHLERMAETAVGHLFMTVPTQADIQTLVVPKGIEQHWIVAPAEQGGQRLVNAIMQMNWPAGSAAVWCAAEFTAVKTLRRYFKAEKQVDKQRLYISSYWKQGATEDEHKVAKQVA